MGPSHNKKTVYTGSIENQDFCQDDAQVKGCDITYHIEILSNQKPTNSNRVHSLMSKKEIKLHVVDVVRQKSLFSLSTCKHRS